jgi:hypothetical protein
MGLEIILKEVSFKEGRFDVKIVGRGKLKSPETYLIHYKNRWITPYENEKRKHVTWTGSGLLRVLYADTKLSSLIYSRNPFLNHNETPLVNYFPEPIG